MCVTRLAARATPPPWLVSRVETQARAYGLLPASLWQVRDGSGEQQLILCLLPEAERERAAIAAWRACSRERLRHGLGEATCTEVAEAAGNALCALIESGVIEVN